MFSNYFFKKLHQFTIFTAVHRVTFKNDMYRINGLKVYVDSYIGWDYVCWWVIPPQPFLFPPFTDLSGHSDMHYAEVIVVSGGSLSFLTPLYHYRDCLYCLKFIFTMKCIKTSAHPSGLSACKYN